MAGIKRCAALKIGATLILVRHEASVERVIVARIIRVGGRLRARIGIRHARAHGGIGAGSERIRAAILRFGAFHHVHGMHGIVGFWMRAARGAARGAARDKREKKRFHFESPGVSWRSCSAWLKRTRATVSDFAQ